MTEKKSPSSADGKILVSGPAANVNLDSQSVAGEEDPGASLDTPGSLPPNLSGATVSMPSDAVNPADEAPEGTSGTAKESAVSAVVPAAGVTLPVHHVKAAAR